jgi:hypothetical protein
MEWFVLLTEYQSFLPLHVVWIKLQAYGFADERI